MSIYIGSKPSTSSGTGSNSFTIQSKVPPYTAIINDYVLASGTSGTITLPTAVGVSGQQIALQHSGTSLSQVYAINTNSAQTIGGIASGAYALYTNGENLHLVSDGANWQIENHFADTAWTSYTPTGSWSTNTTFTGLWKRNGDVMFVQAHVSLSGTPTVANLTVNIPSNATIDTTKLLNTSVSRNPLGWGFYTFTGNATYPGYVTYNSTTSIIAQFYSLPTATQVQQGGVNATAPFAWVSTDVADMNWSHPITGWQP